MNALQKISLFIVLLSSHPGRAAEKVLTWQDCVRLISENNDDLRASERSLQSYEYQVNGAYSNFFPQVSGSLSYSQGNASTTTVPSTTETSYTASLTATENLFSGFQDMAKVSQAKSNRDVAKISYQSAKAKISYDLKSALAGFLYAQKYVSLTQNIIQRREFNLKTVQLRFETGRENKGSLLLSKAYLEDARLDNLKAMQGLYVAQSELARVLGMEDSETIGFKDKIPTAEPPPEGQLDFKKLVLETPAYQQAVAQESLATAGVSLAQAGFYPSLSLSATAGDYGATWYPDSHRWSLGAALTFPLFNGGRDYNASRSAGESLKSSRFARAGQLKNQLVQLKNAYVDFIQALQKLKVDQAYVEASTAREKVSRQKYNNGLATFDDWDIIENDLIKRQKDLLISERDRVTFEAAWEQAQGRGVLP
jgi:outer membrane protein